MESEPEYQATNIRLPRDTLQAMKLKAVEQHKSLAQMVREAVEQTYGLPKPARSAKAFRQDSLFSVIGLCQTGIRDGSVHHDRELYGRKPKRPER